MTLHGRPGKNLSIVKNGFESGHIGILVSTAKNIVMQDHIPLMNIISEVFNDLLAYRLKRKSQHRNVLSLLQHPAFGIVNAGHKVPGLVEDGGPCCPQQGIAHLLGDRLKAALENRGKYSVLAGFGFHFSIPFFTILDTD